MNQYYSIDPEIRFWDKVNIVPSGCWEWQGARLWLSFGYGLFGFERKTVRAHRFSYEHFVGPIPPDMLVLHRCDNPPCVNPEHLFLGTQKENIADCIAKGRFQAAKRARSHCKYGHELVAANDRRRLGRARVCKTCRNDRQRIRRARRSA